MHASLNRFKFPKPAGAATDYTWNGRQFADRGGNTSDVLCYTQAQSNWSDDLTSMHEQEAGSHHPIDIASRQLAIETISAHFPTGEPVVLEVGCSSGFLLEDLSRQLPRAAIIGADYIASPLRNLAGRLKEVPLLQFDLRCCPLPNACVDAVVCLNVLEHIDDHAAAMAHIYRILKPGGIAHVEVPAGPRLYDVYDELLMHHRRYRMSGLSKLTAQAGFQTVRSTHLGCSVFPMFALKKLWNRRALRLPPAEKKRLVTAQIRGTADSGMLRTLLGLETTLGRHVRFPFGIRCVTVVRKPA